MRAIRYIPSAIWTVLIVYLLTKDADGLPRFWWLQFPHVDKLIHAGLFGVGGLLITLAIDGRTKALFTVLVWALLLGISTEYMQHCCVESRSGEVADVLADVVGALAAAFIFRRWQGR